MKVKGKKLTSIGAVFALTASMLTGLGVPQQTANAATDYGLSNPRVEMQTRDVIEFGSYWQEDTNGDGKADRNDEKTPIKWQIIRQDGDDLFLLADQVLDCKEYNEEDADVTWETCTLRAWLNSDFYSAAFSSSEQSAVKDTLVTNEDNPYYEAEGGNDTTDKLFLLSRSEVTNADYGFQSDEEFYDQARHGKATEYAKEQCYTSDEGTSRWWLRSPGYNGTYATLVPSDGCVDSSGIDVDGSSGVRPALHVNAANATISMALANKTKEEVALAKTTWDTVEFGTYNGEKITWRVLSVDGDDALLLADRILLMKEYNEELTDVTWETSTLRTWLNDDFYKEAFTSAEQAAIKETTLSNEDNPFYGAPGGRGTTDSVYLLSLNDIVNQSYGFPTAYNCDSASRQAVSTVSKEQWWWLRSPGYDNTYATNVRYDGYVDYGGGDVGYNISGVRPALHLNLSSSVWTKGEVVIVDDGRTAITDPLPGGESSGGESGSGGTTEDDKGNSGGANSGSETGANTNSGMTNDSGTNANSGSADNTSITAPAKVKSLKVTNKKKGKTVVSFKKVSGAAGYQIQYAKNKKFTKGKKSKTTKKTSYTVKKLKKKKTYYFRVRAYKLSGKKKVYGKWSKVKKVNIKK